MQYAEMCEHFLWRTKQGQPYLEYLRGRGLKDEIISEKRFGFMPLAQDGRWQQDSFADWGLTEEMLSPEQLAKGCVRVPDGLVIPWFIHGNELWKITIKRPFAGPKELSYGQIVGSRECLYNYDLVSSALPAMLTESVIDCLSVEQEAGDLVIPVATDSAARCRLPRWIARMAQAPFVLQSFDADEPGDKGAEEWMQLLANCTRWVPLAHDSNDMLKAHMNVRQWVQLGIKTAEAAPALTVSLDMPVNGEAAVEEKVIDDTCSVCGAEVEHYSAEGVAYCSAHYLQVEMQAVYDEILEEQPDPFVGFASAVSRIASIFPGGCEIHRVPPGYTLAEHVKKLYPGRKCYDARSYFPETLPELPRKQCPFQYIDTQTRYGGKRAEYLVASSCKAKTLDNGWCEKHQYIEEMLQAAARAGYPRLEFYRKILRDGQLVETGWAIGEGKGNWEYHASCHSQQKHQLIMSKLKSLARAS
jgi:hypothetical protein